MNSMYSFGNPATVTRHTRVEKHTQTVQPEPAVLVRDKAFTRVNEHAIKKGGVYGRLRRHPA